MINVERISEHSDWDVRIFTIKGKFADTQLYGTYFEKKNNAIKFVKEYMKIPSGAIAYIVKWMESDYKNHYKMFIGNPQDSPDIIYNKAKKFHMKKYDNAIYINLSQIY